MRADGAANAIKALLNKRGQEKTICPSEAARVLAGKEGNWRDQMEDIHRAVDQLIDAQAITLSWKGKVLDRRCGPYRIAHRRPSM